MLANLGLRHYLWDQRLDLGRLHILRLVLVYVAHNLRNLRQSLILHLEVGLKATQVGLVVIMRLDLVALSEVIHAHLGFLLQLFGDLGVHHVVHHGIAAVEEMVACVNLLVD